MPSLLCYQNNVLQYQYRIYIRWYRQIIIIQKWLEVVPNEKERQRLLDVNKTRLPSLLHHHHHRRRRRHPQEKAQNRLPKEK